MWNTIRTMLLKIAAIVMVVLPILEQIAVALDAADLTFLVVLAIGMHFVAQQFVRDQTAQVLAARCSSIVLIAYFVHRYRLSQPSAWDELLGEVGRSLVVTWFCYGPLLVAIPVFRRVLWRGLGLVGNLWHWLLRLASWLLAMRHIVNVAAEPPRPAPPTTSLASMLAVAKEKFNEECSLIRTAGLSPHEEETLLTNAKQRYLKQLKELMP